MKARASSSSWYASAAAAASCTSCGTTGASAARCGALSCFYTSTLAPVVLCQSTANSQVFVDLEGCLGLSWSSAAALTPLWICGTAVLLDLRCFLNCGRTCFQFFLPPDLQRKPAGKRRKSAEMRRKFSVAAFAADFLKCGGNFRRNALRNFRRRKF